MSIDVPPDDLDSLRELVAHLSSERDAALAECKRVMEQNDRLLPNLRSRDSGGDIRISISLIQRANEGVRHAYSASS